MSNTNLSHIFFEDLKLWLEWVQHHTACFAPCQFPKETDTQVPHYILHMQNKGPAESDTPDQIAIINSS